MVQMSKIADYMKNNRLSYAKLADSLGFDVAYVYRSLNKKGNSVTKLVKPSSRFLGTLKSKHPELYRIVKEALSL